MLTPYDDLPYHQLSTTFDHAGTSDPRFFDRYWFVAYDRGGEACLATGLGVYKNTNVCDAFASVVSGGVQHNLRLSRALRPNFDIAVGPLRYDVLEGLKRIRLVLDDDEHDIAFDLVFEASFPAFEEDHHFLRSAGVVREDFRRYYQHGTARGVIVVGNRKVRSDDFWSFRDRSFGVRPGMGGPMPPIAPEEPDDTGAGSGRTPALFFGGAFGSRETVGVCRWTETADGNLLQLDGRVVRGAAPVKIEAVRHDLAFHDQAVVAGGTVRYRLADGTDVVLELEELGSPLAYAGFGYAGGYADGLGLGAYRGTFVAERDRFDVGTPTRLVDRSGRHQFGPATLLDQPMRTTINGEPGFMELVAGLRSKHHRYRPRGAV